MTVSIWSMKELPNLNLKTFLNIQKNRLKSWNNTNLQANNIKKECERLQTYIDLDSSDNLLINQFFNMQIKLINSLHAQVVENSQKAKTDWLTLGDTPSKFFYAKMSNRKYINDIGKLLDSKGEIINEASKLKE